MKKILFFASALAGLFFAASCQQEEFAPVEESNVVTFEVGIPEVATKAALGDDVSNINDLAYAVYRTSKTTEDEAKADPELQLIYQKNYDVNPFQGGKATIPIELINDQNYLIVFWAQNENKWVSGAFDPKNAGIAYPTPMASNNNDLAAFTNVAFLSKDDIKGGAIKRGVELERPFAQINIGTTLPKNVAETVELYRSSVTVTGAGASYNPITKEIVASTNPVVFNLAEVPGGKLSVNSTDYEYVAMNYIFANGSVGVAFNIETKKHGTVVTEAIPEVPVQTNYRTNIVGNLLTSEAEYSVTLDKTWGEPAKIYELWDGTTVAKPEEETDETTGETTYVVEAASELAYLAALVNGTLPSTFAITKASEPKVFNIKLTADVDLNNMQWTAIGTETNNFTGSFDGNNHTIKNLKIAESEAKEGKAYLGFFGYAKNATIKNVTFENVNLNIACLDIDHSQGHIGAVAGSLEGTSTIENVTVKGDIKVESTVTANGASRVAVVAGGNSYGNVTMKNVHVIANEGSYLKANNNLGALAGQLQGKSVFENCSSNINVTGTKFFAGGIIGLAAGDQTFTNCHTTGNVTITAGREGRNHDQYRVGGIAGGWADGAKNVCTLTNCSYTGNISGKNSDGSIANPLDCEGFVGRGYSVVVGATVNVNGKKYIYKGNGKYSVDGTIEVANAYELLAVAGTIEDGDTILLTDNVTFTEANRSFNSGTWYDGLYYIGDKSFTIDLGGKTIGQEDDAVNDYLLNFKNDGAKTNTITLKNGTIDAGTAAFCALATSSSNAQKMTINLENLNLVGENSGGAVIKFRGGAELNVNAGTVITGKNSYVGIECVNATTNIYEGAKIYQKGTGSYVGSLVGVSNNGVLNVYGGEGTSVQGAFIAMTSGGTINVYGGEWIANVDGTYANGNKSVLIAQSASGAKSVINVTGGTFKGGYNCYGDAAGDAQINIKGGNFNANPETYVVKGYEAKDENGIYVVSKKPEATVNGTSYGTLAEAVAAAKAGDTVTVIDNVELSSELALPAGIIFNGNGKQINGTIYADAEGNLTFAGHTKVTSFSASYYNRTITIGEGACLEVTGTGRVTLGYGNTFNITGSLEHAKTADKANVQPSLIIPGGISITGGNDAAMNVTNAYVQIGSTTSKPGAANGEFTLNFTNSIVEFTKELGFYDPTGGVNPQFKMSITNSVFTTGTKLFLTASSEVTVDNSTVALGSYIHNSGLLELKNGSILTGATIQFGENGGNNGTITVDNSSLTVKASSTGNAFDGKGDGTITAKNNAKVSVDYYKAMTIVVDETSTFTGTKVQ